MASTTVIKPLQFTRSFILCLAAAVTFSMGTLPGFAQQPAQQPAQSSSPVDIRPDASDAPHSWTIEQLLPLTVSEAWQMSGKSEDKFFDMVQDLAAFSAQKRNLVLPATEAAGRQAGEYIKQQAKQDHNQLLYAVVDQAVRKVGKPGSAQASAATPK
jgi:uncharacterized protein involved in copper resistance